MQTTSKISGRVAFYDNIKFVMITLMVIGHFIDVHTGEDDISQSIYIFIYAFHMPMLLFVSGLFYSDRNNTAKIVFYLSCGFALKIARFAVYMFCGEETQFQLLEDDSAPWFMFTLAAFQFLMHILRKIDARYLFGAFILLACFAGYDATIGDYLYLSRTIIFFPFYLLGTILAADKVVEFFQKHFARLSILGAAIIGGWFYLCFWHKDLCYVLRPLFTGRNPFEHEVHLVGASSRALCYAITFLLIFGIMIWMPKKQIPFFSKLGQRTLNVYFWHWLIFLLLDRFFDISGLFAHGREGKIVYVLIAIGLSILLAAFKVFDYPLDYIKALCYKKVSKNMES